MPALAAELAALRPDILVSHANAGPLALQKAISTIPIVMTSPTDPVGSGMVTSLARPGGNITGLSTMSADLNAKRLELLLGMAPNLSTVALLLNPANPVSRPVLESLIAAAQAPGIRILAMEAQTLKEIESAFGAMVAQKARADRVIE